MKKKIILSSLTIGGIIAGGLLTSISTASNVKYDYKTNNLINRKWDNSNANVQLNFSHFTQNAKIANMKIWNMKNDNHGKALNNSYQGVIVPVGAAISNSDIENILINKAAATITWDKPYNANAAGIYTATINQGSSSFDFKIFVTGSSFDFPGVFHNKTLPAGFLFPSNVSSIVGVDSNSMSGDDIFQGSKLNDDFTIPNKFTKIDESVFEAVTLNDNFRIPNSVTSIGENAFKYANLNDNFTIPSSVTSIGNRAFQNATLKDNFTIPSSVTSIGDGVLSYSSLPKSFKIPNYFTSIPKEFLKNVSLNDDFSIPSSVASIEENAFADTTLNNNFTIPSSVTSIGPGAFTGANLNDNFTIPSSLTSIGEGLFRATKLNDNFTIPSSVTSIGPDAFLSATLNDNFRIPNSVTSIGATAFAFANLNDNFTIPSSVTSIGPDAFTNSELHGYPITSTSNINSLNEDFDTIKSVINIIKKFIKDSNNHDIFKDKYNFNHNFSNGDLFNLLKSKYDPTNNKAFSSKLKNHFILKTKYDKSNLIISFLPSLGSDVYIPYKYFKPTKAIQTKTYNEKAKIVATNDDLKSNSANTKASEFFTETKDNVYVSKGQNKSWYEEASLLKNVDNTKEKWFKVEIDRINNKNNSKAHAFTLDDLKTRAGNENNFEKQKTYLYVKLDSDTKDNDVVFKTDLINNNYTKTNAEIKWIKTDQTWDLKLFYKNTKEIGKEGDSIYRYKITQTSKEDIIKYQKAYNQKDKIVAVNDDLLDNYTKEFFTETNDRIYVSTIEKKDTQEKVSLIKTFTGDKEKLFKVEIDWINNHQNWSNSPFTINDLKAKASNEKNFEKQKTFFYATLNSNTKDQSTVYETNLVNKSHRKFHAQVKWIKTGQTWDLKLFYNFPSNLISARGEDDAIHRFKATQISKEDTIKYQNEYNQKDKIVVVNDNLLDKYTNEFFNETSNHVYFSTILKSYNEEGVSLIKFFPNDKAKLFKVEINRINNNHNHKSSPFTFNEVKAKIKDENNYDKAKKFVYAAWDSNTKDQDIVFEKDLINSAGRKFRAQVKWIKTGQTWDLKLFYTFPSNWPSLAGEDDSIYRYKTFDASSLANAKPIALQAIDDIKPSKTLVTGAIKPETEWSAFDIAVAKVKKEINNTTNVADLNSAKASGIKTVTSARNALDSAIEAANQVKEASDLADAKTTAIQAIDDIKSQKKLIDGTTEPKSEKTAFDDAVSKARKAINEAKNVTDLNSAKASGIKTVTSARDALDSAIEAANQVKEASDLADAKTTAIQAIDDIKSQKKLIDGTTEPKSEKTAFDDAVSKARKAINEAKNVTDLNSAKASGIKTVTSVRDTLDKEITLANEKQKTKLVVEKIKMLTQKLERNTNDYIEAIPEGTILNAESFKSLADNSKKFPSDTTNFKITYSHKEMVESGSLPVSLKVKNLKSNEEKLINFVIDVKGINKEKAEESKDILLTKKKLEKFDHMVSNLKNRKEILPSSLKNISSPEGFGLKIPNDLPKDIKIDYSTEANDKNGTLKVKALISGTRGTQREAIFTLGGFKRDIKKSKSILSKYIIAIIASLGAVILIISGLVILKIVKNKKKKGKLE